ncbi:MAG: asparagine synthase (glutamine-hydrolyzing) [Burkholderiales bacterium]|nr:asparagine synthase (glutamine-hydrolyzing) [Burkholderiales bacterium]
MCGIAGAVDFSIFSSVSAESMWRMTSMLHHRGPDRSDVVIDGAAGLGHARLSIIDLSDAGHQPMHSADGRFVIVYNGEVYNFRELRAELERGGISFRGHSDTEVVLNAWARWGPAVLTRLNGIFAFAIWDRHEQELVLARDRFGVKPLSFHRLANGIVFGSEIKAILASGLVSAQVNPQALHEFAYFGASLGRSTLFDGIERLEPGHWLRLSDGRCEILPYWRAEDVCRIEDDDATAVEKTRVLVEAAVRRQLVSDVPVGVFLSGGIDSSVVTAFASRHYEGTIKTYSVGFDFDRGVNELPRARRVAERFGTDHHEFHLAGGSMPAVIEDLVRRHDEPFSDAANIPLYLLCRELNGEPRVILQGDGGDEIFGGYRRYALLSYYNLWKALSTTRGFLPDVGNGKLARLHRILDAFGQQEDAMRMALLLTMDTSRTSFVQLLSPAWQSRLRQTDPFRRYREMAQRLRALDPVQQMLYCDTNVLLPDVFLEKVDKATMAFSIESRVPLLDNDLTDYAMGLPSRMKVRGSNKKWLLKKALRGVVPDEVLDAPKTGFGVPFSYWLATSLLDYARVVFNEAVARPDSFFDSKTLFSVFETHRAKPEYQSGFILWKALNLAIWQRQYLRQ